MTYNINVLIVKTHQDKQLMSLDHISKPSRNREIQGQRLETGGLHQFKPPVTISQ